MLTVAAEGDGVFAVASGDSAELLAHNRAFDRDRRLLEIHVPPPQPQNLTGTHVRIHGKNRHEPDMRSQLDPFPGE